MARYDKSALFVDKMLRTQATEQKHFLFAVYYG